MEKKRSKGIAVFSVILMIYGLGCSMCVTPSFLKKAPFSLIEIVAILPHLALLFYFFIGGIFIFYLKNWARKLMVVWCTLAFLSVIYYLYVGLSGEAPYMVSVSLPMLVIYSVPIYVLTRPKIKEQFK